MDAHPTMTSKLPKRTLFLYSLGSIGTGLFSTTPAVLLLYYMTQILGISASLAGFAVLVPKLWDMVTDPMVGVISDRTRTRFGRRRPYLLAGAILMPLGLAFMFAAPESLSQTQAFWYVFILYAISATAYTLFSVPYITIPAEISKDTRERTTIMSFRTAFVMLGILIGSALPPMLVEHFGGDRLAYRDTGIVLAIVCTLTMLTAVFALKNVKLIEPEVQSRNLRQDIKNALTTPLFLYLCLTHILQIAAVGVILAASAYLAVFVLKSGTGLAGDFLGLTFLCAFIAMPVWNRLCQKMGKTTAFGVGGVIYAVMAITLVLAGVDMAVSTFLVIGGGMGIGFAAVQMIPYALLTDVIHAHGEKHGFGNEGIFTGIWTALEKFGLALAPFFFGVLLDMAGFLEGKGAAEQPAGIAERILWLGGGLPVTLIISSFIGLYLFQKQSREA